VARSQPHAGTVGDWIKTRRAELGMTQAQLAEEVNVSVRTVTSVERGESAVTDRKRPAWERVLGWPSGSLTVAYRLGIKPDRSPPSPARKILDRVGIPDRLASDQSVVDVLGSSLTDADKMDLLRVWWTSRQSIETALQDRELRERPAQ
jgi:transcriptional regulator with XRE-family HTH domain